MQGMDDGGDVNDVNGGHYGLQVLRCKEDAAIERLFRCGPYGLLLL